MKIQKIQSLCKSAKRIIIFNDADEGIQWISDGYCLFPLLNLPRLTEDNIYALFDIPKDKRGKIFFEEREELPKSLCFEDSFEEENAVNPEQFGIYAYGQAFDVFRGAEGALLVDSKYLSAFDKDVTYFERLRRGASPYIVAKEGMFVSGVILPFEANITLKEWMTNVAESLRYNEEKE
jgi:hypothetical protein